MVASSPAELINEGMRAQRMKCGVHGISPSPLLLRRGGCASNKDVAKPPKRRRRGGRSQRNVSECEFKTLCVSDHPVRSIKGGFAAFLDVASTPPQEEGSSFSKKNL